MARRPPKLKFAQKITNFFGGCSRMVLELITGDDNLTFEPAYFWGACALLVGLGLEIWAVTHSKPFDIQAYGIGAGALLLGVGGGKKLATPDVPPPPTPGH